MCACMCAESLRLTRPCPIYIVIYFRSILYQTGLKQSHISLYYTIIGLLLARNGLKNQYLKDLNEVRAWGSRTEIRQGFKGLKTKTRQRLINVIR